MFYKNNIEENFVIGGDENEYSLTMNKGGEVFDKNNDKIGTVDPAYNKGGKNIVLIIVFTLLVLACIFSVVFCYRRYKSNNIPPGQTTKGGASTDQRNLRKVRKQEIANRIKSPQKTGDNKPLSKTPTGKSLNMTNKSDMIILLFVISALLYQFWQKFLDLTDKLKYKIIRFSQSLGL